MHRALQFKNATVSLMLLVPLILLLVTLLTKLAQLSSSLAPPRNEPPPFFVLSEAEGYTFATGSATPSEALKDALTDSIPSRIISLSSTYPSDIIEVIGHTDGQRVGRRGNLDDSLLAFVQGPGVVPSPGSNVDLGMLRAWEVVRILRSVEMLHAFTFVAYSAGQVLDTNTVVIQELNYADQPHRRRIEIRLRRRASLAQGR